jgi:hypothetical protein
MIEKLQTIKMSIKEKRNEIPSNQNVNQRKTQ